MALFPQSTIGFALVVLWMCLKTCNALTCYECNSYTDKRCLGDEQNKLDDDLKKACPEKSLDGNPYKLCRKIKQVVDFEVNGLQPEARVIRTCGWDDSHYKNRCYQRSGFGGRQEVCACESNNCNGALTVIASTFLTGAMLLVLRV